VTTKYSGHKSSQKEKIYRAERDKTVNIKTQINKSDDTKVEFRNFYLKHGN